MEQRLRPTSTHRPISEGHGFSHAVKHMPLKGHRFNRAVGHMLSKAHRFNHAAGHMLPEGHGFSHADKHMQQDGALAPEAMLPQRLKPRSCARLNDTSEAVSLRKTRQTARLFAGTPLRKAEAVSLQKAIRTGRNNPGEFANEG